jgi:hypothetical protein
LANSTVVYQSFYELTFKDAIYIDGNIEVIFKAPIPMILLNLYPIQLLLTLIIHQKKKISLAEAKTGYKWKQQITHGK